jgi:TolA-binding protein
MTNAADEFDVGGQGEAQTSPDALAQLREAIQELEELEQIIEQMQEDLKQAKKRREELKGNPYTAETGRIPELMMEMQLDRLTHAGYEVVVEEALAGKLPDDPDRRQAALKYLEANGAEGLIKTDLKLQFGRSQHNEAVSVAEGLRQEGYEPRLESGVHHSSLKAFANERIKNGEPIDTETLGLYTGKVAKTKKVK